MNTPRIPLNWTLRVLRNGSSDRYISLAPARMIIVNAIFPLVTQYARRWLHPLIWFDRLSRTLGATFNFHLRFHHVVGLLQSSGSRPSSTNWKLIKKVHQRKRSCIYIYIYILSSSSCPQLTADTDSVLDDVLSISCLSALVVLSTCPDTFSLTTWFPRQAARNTPRLCAVGRF
jgi:hypothetical protein